MTHHVVIQVNRYSLVEDQVELVGDHNKICFALWQSRSFGKQNIISWKATMVLEKAFKVGLCFENGQAANQRDGSDIIFSFSPIILA